MTATRGFLVGRWRGQNFRRAAGCRDTKQARPLARWHREHDRAVRSPCALRTDAFRDLTDGRHEVVAERDALQQAVRENPIDWPSGEKNGEAAPSVPSMARGSNAAMALTWRRPGRPSWPWLTYASC